MVVRKKWAPKGAGKAAEVEAVGRTEEAAESKAEDVEAPVVRKKWAPKGAGSSVEAAAEAVVEGSGRVEAAPVRRKWEPKKSVKPPDSGE